MLNLLSAFSRKISNVTGRTIVRIPASYSTNLRPRNLDEAVTFREVPIRISDGAPTTLSDVYRGFAQSLYENAETITEIR